MAIIPATSKPGLHSAIYAVAVVLVGLMALQLKWEIKDNTLGFTDRPFTLSYLASLTYLLFFINPPGSGWISFFVLLVPYLPFSRAGHAWMAYRAYSLWIFLTFAHVLGLIDFYRTPPAALDELLQSIRHSTLSEIVLLVAVVSVGHLTWQRWTAFRRNSSTTSRANVANQETSGN